ncbi:MAG: hypothetical protein HYZ44_07665 [Bacteroidetes bacterium]|nr:hypothetical protein [Bacteroidota bacterium]
MNRLEAFSKRTYETQLVLLISIVAILRLVVALLIDFLRESIRWGEVMTDITILIVFVAIAWLAFNRAHFTKVHPLFGVILIILLGLNYMEFGGVQGNSRFNYYGGFFFVILLYQGRTLVVLLTFQCLFLVALTGITVFQEGGRTALFVSNDSDFTDFVFILIALGALSFYLKNITENEIGRWQQLSNKLNEQVAHAKDLNHELVTQGKELMKAQAHLEEEVNKKSRLLLEQQNAIQRYIQLNTEVIHDPVHELNREMSRFPGTNLMDSMLIASHAELNEVLKNITATLKANEELNRTKV